MADGFWHFPFRRNGRTEPNAPVALTAIPAVLSPEESVVSGTFNDTSVTSGEDINIFDFDAVLRDKERHIYDIYRIADYYVDKDP